MSFQLHSVLEADSIILGQFKLCLLLLINDSQYPWFVLVPQRHEIKEIYQMSQSDQQQFWLESNDLSQVLMKLFKGDKLNVAAIGNMVPQLHLHHVVRFKDDPCWPKPVWGQLPMKSYDQQQAEYVQRKIIQNLHNYGFKSVK